MRVIILTAALLTASLLAGCAEEAVETQDIVTVIPWSDNERAEYILFDRDGEEERGSGTLEVSRQGDQFELSLRFVGEGNTDVTIVVVDAESLRPVSVRRERVIDGETEIVEAEYDPVEEVIRVVEIEDGDERTVPRRLDEEQYYDNESSLFLWRTITFEEEFEISYHTVLANQGGAQRAVTLNVIEKEEVTVPAGTFDTWRVEITTGDVDQVAWFADRPDRALVQYDNSVQLFQLTALSP